MQIYQVEVMQVSPMEIPVDNEKKFFINLAI